MPRINAGRARRIFSELQPRPHELRLAEPIGETG